MKAKLSFSRRLRAAVMATLMAGAFSLSPVVVSALPVGGVSVGNTANIAVLGNDMIITGNKGGNLLTWLDFSIAANEWVKFTGDGQFSYLNYVNGNSVSTILGRMSGEANIYLVNPNGIQIGDGAKIDVGALYLSTANLNDSLADFNTALGALTAADSFAGDIVNKGNLNAAQTITVEGRNITIKNVADVTKGAAWDDSGNRIAEGARNTDVTLKAVGGEIHIGSADASPSGYTVSGAEEIDYKLISGVEGLNSIINDRVGGSYPPFTLPGNYMLAGDVDMSGRNFAPVASSTEVKFTGRFDGLGYTIKNMTINTAQSYAGLFGYVEGGVIENIGLIDSDVKIQSSYACYAGGIIGYNDNGTVRNVYNIGKVEAKAVNGGAHAGGIVGYNKGNRSQISNAYHVGNVLAQAEGAWAGGITGWNNGTITNAYHTDGVNDTDKVQTNGRSAYSGGIAGSNNGTISKVYSTGRVSATSSSVYGITDRNGRVSDAFYVKLNNNDTNGKTLDELMVADTFVGWEIDKDGSNPNASWRIYEGTTTPLLTAFMTRKDNITEVEYDGSVPGGTFTAVPSANVSTQQGINWINDITFVKPAPVVKSETKMTEIADVMKVVAPDIVPEIKPAPPSVPTAVPLPEPTPTTANVVEEQLQGSNVTISQWEDATNAVAPNVQSHAAAAVSEASTPAEQVQTDRNSEEKVPATSDAEVAANSTAPAVRMGDGELVVENKGINPPESMSTESIAVQQNGTAEQPAQESKGNSSKQESQDKTENDNA